MRRTILALAVVASAMLLSIGAATAQDPQPKDRTITVIGTGTIKYKPEIAKVSFGIRASDNAFATAWKDNQVQADKMKTALEALTIKGMQVKISPPDVNHNEINNGGVAPAVPGGGNDKAYNVLRSFQVVLQDADFAQLHKHSLKVIETAMNHGANSPANTPANNNQLFLGNGFQQGTSITRVEFHSSDDGFYRKKAFQKAVQAALTNAEGAAQGANLKVGDILSVVEYQEANPNVGLGLGLPDTVPHDVDGEVELVIRVRLTVKF